MAIAHNAAAVLLEAAAACMLRATRADGRALTFEVGIQNSGLAIVIIVGQLKGFGGAAAIAAVWGVWHLIAGGLLSLVLRYFDRSEIKNMSLDLKITGGLVYDGNGGDAAPRR
ncbi:MAG: hypothetical protein IIB77_13910 [Proteobacteria bacterium]|nr:hypothetical protein [Pseudomonadota bacterium]